MKKKDVKPSGRLLPAPKDSRGYTAKELHEYVPKEISEQFYEALGVNTVMCDPDGTTYTYEHDVDRALRFVLFKTPTYFD